MLAQSTPSSDTEAKIIMEEVKNLYTLDKHRVYHYRKYHLKNSQLYFNPACQMLAQSTSSSDTETKIIMEEVKNYRH